MPREQAPCQQRATERGTRGRVKIGTLRPETFLQATTRVIFSRLNSKSCLFRAGFDSSDYSAPKKAAPRGKWTPFLLK